MREKIFPLDMYVDLEAVQHLNLSIQGRTVHRRGIRGLGGRFCDLHLRVSEAMFGTEKFPPHYCQQLGSELALLDAKVFQDYLLTLFNSVTDVSIVGTGNVVAPEQIFLAMPSTDGRLFTVLRSSLLSVITGNYMCKWVYESLPLFYFPILASDHSSFLQVASIYREPLPVSNQYRVMLEIGSTYSQYSHGLPVVGKEVNSKLVPPQVLNRSL